jgi:phage-related protein
MIMYKGVALESVAPVKVEDIRVSPIQLNATVRTRPVFPGSDFVRMVRGTRTVSIVFALLNKDMHTRQRQLQEVSKWAFSETEMPLTLPNYPDLYLNCICTGLPEPSTRQWWESKLRITFTAYDNPFFTSIAEKHVSCGTEFFACGDAPPLVRIETTLGASDSLTYSDGTNTMVFGTYTDRPTGSLVIDLNRQTAAVGSTSIMKGYTFASRFIIPKPGISTITGTGTVYWRERWM